MLRRDFFNSLSTKKTAKNINPPYFSGNFDCNECEEHPCISACEKELLKFIDNEIAFMPNELGCDFCECCAKACINDTISLKNSPKIDATYIIQTSSCLAWNNTICYNCQDVCKFNSIKYFGMFRPLIDETCVGCGECVGACFNNSITFKPNNK